MYKFSADLHFSDLTTTIQEVKKSEQQKKSQRAQLNWPTSLVTVQPPPSLLSECVYVCVCRALFRVHL